VAWTIEYTQAARKTVAKLDATSRRRIRLFLEERVAAADNPRATGKALSGPLATLWSYRVGDFRVICEIQDRRLIVLVVAIGNRRDVYR
jgi:mRNA interferase RelE/StbE